MDLLDLKSGDCRFPLNDDLPYAFCGAATVRGPYCKEHADLCYDDRTPKSWQGLAGMIKSTENTILHVGEKKIGDFGYVRRGEYSKETVNPIDEVFANSRIGEKPLLERVL